MKTGEVILKAKRDALKLFVGRLLNFGSPAEGKAEEGNDIDLPIFATGEIEQLRKLCAQLAFEVGLKTGQSVEPIAYPLHKSGKLPREWGRDMRRALEVRNRAGYDWTTPPSQGRRPR